jgi:hypothetical protein
VAVATDRECDLYIAARESAEPVSGEVRDLIQRATGEPLARAALVGDVDGALEAARAATGLRPINPFGL